MRWQAFHANVCLTGGAFHSRQKLRQCHEGRRRKETCNNVYTMRSLILYGSMTSFAQLHSCNNFLTVTKMKQGHQIDHHICSLLSLFSHRPQRDLFFRILYLITYKTKRKRALLLNLSFLYLNPHSFYFSLSLSLSHSFFSFLQYTLGFT